MLGVQSGVTNNELRVHVQAGDAQRVLTFASEHTVWIGRDASCDVVLDSQEVSRRHASIFVKDGQLFVRDHSSYGTRVDGLALQRAVRAVCSPASLLLGPYRLELSWAGESFEFKLSEAAPWRLPRPAFALLALILVCAAAWARFAREPTRPEQAPASSSATGKPCPVPPAGGARAPSVQSAVALLRAGDRASALHAYRALAARDDSRAEFAIVASLLARELSCQP